MKLKVTEQFNKERLDKMLSRRLKGYSRSQIQKLIKNGSIVINDRKTSVHQFLKTGDVINITTQPSVPGATETLPTTSPPAEPKIIFENDDFIVIEKPVRLLVHPTEKNEPNTLVDWLIARDSKIAKVGEQSYRAGIIHRLDKDVSGVMVAAKTQQAFDYFKQQFKQRAVQKKYRAIVYGHLTEPSGEIDLPIGRSKKTGQFVAHPRHGKEKLQDKDRIAKTKYRVVEYIKDYTVLDVEILTGRTHQIRAHLSAIGHPIIGDNLYKPKKKFFNFLRTKIKVVNPGRILLHSQTIGFYNLKNQWVEFGSPIPEKITRFINDQKTK